MQFSKLISLLFLLLPVFISCNNENKKVDSQFNSLDNYFRTNHDYIISEKIDKIAVVTQNGCPGCNANFANFTLTNLVNDSTIILVTSNGTGIDISGFRQIGSNVFFDENINESNDLGLFAESGVIFLKSRKIDTIITIEAESVYEQFSQILNR